MRFKRILGKGLVSMLFFGLIIGFVGCEQPPEMVEITISSSEDGFIEKKTNGSWEKLEEGERSVDPETSYQLRAVAEEGYELKNWEVQGADYGDEENLETEEITLTDFEDGANINVIFEEVEIKKSEITFNEENDLEGVTIQLYGDEEMEEEIGEELTTDAEGQAEILLEDGQYWFTANKETFEEYHDDFQVAEAEKTVDFILEKITNKLTINQKGEGTILIDEEEIETPFNEEYTVGTELEIKAMAAEGYEFKEWAGDLEKTDEKITLKMEEDIEIEAVFDHKKYDITVKVTGVEEPSHASAFELFNDNYTYTFSEDDYSLEEKTITHTTEEIFKGEEQINLSVKNEDVEDFHYTFAQGKEEKETAISYLKREVIVQADDHQVEELGFSGTKTYGLGIIFIEQGKIRIENNYNAQILDLEEGILTQGNHTPRNSNEINIDPEKGFITQDGNDLILDFSQENLQDNRTENREGPIKFILLDNEDNVISRITVDLDIEEEEEPN